VVVIDIAAVGYANVILQQQPLVSGSVSASLQRALRPAMPILDIFLTPTLRLQQFCYSF